MKVHHGYQAECFHHVNTTTKTDGRLCRFCERRMRGGRAIIAVQGLPQGMIADPHVNG